MARVLCEEICKKIIRIRKAIRTTCRKKKNAKTLKTKLYYLFLAVMWWLLG